MKQEFIEFIKNEKGFKRRFRLDSISEVEYNPSESKLIHIFKGDKEYQFEDIIFNLHSMKIVNDYLQRKKRFLESIHKPVAKSSVNPITGWLKKCLPQTKDKLSGISKEKKEAVMILKLGHCSQLFQISYIQD